MKTLNKILLLFRHAKSAVSYGNLPEARLYYRKIINSKNKNNISKSDLKTFLKADGGSCNTNPLLDSEPLFTSDSRLFRRRPVLWEEILAKSVADYFRCQLRVSLLNNLKLICGTPANRKLCKESYLFLHKAALREAADYADAEVEVAGSQKTRTERRLLVLSFLFGFAGGLESRLAFLKKAVQSIDEYEREQNMEFNPHAIFLSNAPVLEKKKTGGEQIIKPGQQQKKGKGKVMMLDSGAYFAGMAVGSQTSLSEHLELVENITLTRWNSIEKKKARDRRTEEMRAFLHDSRNRRRRGHSYQWLQNEEEKPAAAFKPFVGVQQRLRFE